MQAIIMAAGKGSRLGSLTEGKPKSFAEIKRKKIDRIQSEIAGKIQCG